jgi:hypothetical protein
MTVLRRDESLAAIAAGHVLQRLGSAMYTTVKFHLKRYYHIRLDENTNLEELGFALQHLLGESAAEVIMQDIYVELDELHSNN